MMQYERKEAYFLNYTNTIQLIFKNSKRICIYAIGLTLLAVGLTLNTKVGLGVSALITTPYCISVIWNLNFGNMTLLLYTCFILIEIVLHLLQNKKNIKLQILIDGMQFPLSIMFTRLLNFFSSIIPDFQIKYMNTFWGSFAGRILIILLAILLIGLGATLSLNMRLIPNPGDGVVQAISDYSGKSLGTTKNLFDLTNILIAGFISIIAVHKIISIGMGTILAVLLVGRVIAVTNYFFQDKMLRIVKTKSLAK